jgi:hypothetical protein
VIAEQFFVPAIGKLGLNIFQLGIYTWILGESVGTLSNCMVGTPHPRFAIRKTRREMH